MALTISASTYCIVAFLAAAPAQTPAFPGADGYGKFTTGGRGGMVIPVTNLFDHGPGSLRAAIEQKGPRTIVFQVSGTIPLESPLIIRHGDLTVAGQTAPGDGICVRNYPTLIEANNVIIRYMRFRLGDEARQQEDALTTMGYRDIIIDHCSLSWGVDEVGSFYDNTNFTLQWSIISESLHSSVHRKGTHGYGAIWGGAPASFMFNLLVHHTSRNPRFNGGRTSNNPKAELVDFRNNVVFNWGFKCAYGGEQGRQNVVANYFKPGPATRHRSVFLEPQDATGQWYVADNVVEGSPEVSSDNWSGGVGGPFATKGRVSEPFPFVTQETNTPRQAYEEVLRHAGASFPVRDAVDLRIIEDVETGRVRLGGTSYVRDPRLRTAPTPNGIIDSQRDVGGWPELRGLPAPVDSDGDGIPDAWELANGLDPNDQQDGASISEGGYTHLELYLNSLVRN